MWIENDASSEQHHKMLLLCQNQQGFTNLSELLSKAYLENQVRGMPMIKKSWIF